MVQKWCTNGSKWVQNGAFGVQKAPKMGPRTVWGPRRQPKRCQDGLQTFQGSKNAAKWCPKGSQKDPKRVPKVNKKLIKKLTKTGVDFEVDFGSILVPFGVPNRTNLVTKMV